MFVYMLLTADNHQVVMKQEESDYIHATFVNVNGCMYCIIVTFPNT